jgi:hypothetical protein
MKITITTDDGTLLDQIDTRHEVERAAEEFPNDGRQMHQALAVEEIIDELASLLRGRVTDL